MLLLKFFHNKQYLNDFLDGVIYCSSPSYYRRSGAKGIGDRFESCQFFADGEDQLNECRIELNGRELSYKTGLRSMTIKRGGDQDFYLHCWFGVMGVFDQSEEISIFHDIQRVAKEFGGDYIAVVQYGKNQEFLRRMRTKEFKGGVFVDYSDNSEDWSYSCKATPYSYQREFRFLYTPREDTQVVNLGDSIVMKSPKGFRDIIDVIDISKIKLEKL